MEIEKQVAELVNEKVTTAKKETESKIDSVKSELETTIGAKTTEINQSVEAVKTDMSEIKTVIDEIAKNSKGMNVENELLNQLKNGEEISKEDLQYRDSLNKLSHSIHPHLIEIYDIRDHLKRKEDNAHCFNN